MSSIPQEMNDIIKTKEDKKIVNIIKEEKKYYIKKSNDYDKDIAVKCFQIAGIANVASLCEHGKPFYACMSCSH
jgi:hypothetical protein